MSKEFWAEAVDCAVYLANQCPTRSVWNKTPQEAWSGRKPNISHLRVFGSIAYAHVPYQKRSKLDDRSEKLVFIGYDHRSKGYKLYNPSKGKIISSRDVEFDEEGAWNWGLQAKDYDFFPLFEEEAEEHGEQQELISPPSSPASSSQGDSSPSSSLGESSRERTPKVRSLQEIYEVTENQNDLTLFCLFAGCEPIGFEEAVQSKRWRDAMNQEIKAIEKNDT
jgi:hypothetical protein